MSNRNVHSNPEQMRALVQVLIRSVNDLKEIRLRLARTLQATDWHDAQRNAFEAEFQMTMTTLIKFIENCEQSHIVYLNQQIRTLEEYLGRRTR